jgi:hypothetical protein
LTEGQSVTFVLRTPPDEVQAMIFGQDDMDNEKPSERERMILTVAITNAE